MLGTFDCFVFNLNANSKLLSMRKCFQCNKIRWLISCDDFKCKTNILQEIRLELLFSILWIGALRCSCLQQNLVCRWLFLQKSNNIFDFWNKCNYKTSWVNEWVGEWGYERAINEWTDEQINELIMNERTKERANERKNEWIN